MEVEIVDHDGEVGFQTRIAGLEYPASAASRPVYGLKPLRADGFTLAGGDSDHEWTCVLRMEAGGCWVETTLIVHRPVTLNPSMILWVGALDHMDDRQAHTWRQTILRGPTTNQQGLSGNDLPACYLYDHDHKIETVCYFPPDAFGWLPQRFYHFGAREVIQYQPQARFGLGLLANSPETSFPFVPGTYRLRWWFTQSVRTGTPTPWQAQCIMLDSIVPLLDPVPVTGEVVSWPEFAHKTLEDLYDESCWTTVDGVTGLRAYVRGSSAVARDEQRGFELMTQLDVLWPLLLWREATGTARADEIINRLLATLRHFARPEHNFVANNFPPRSGDTYMDTWYFLENALIKLPWVAYLTGEDALKSMFKSALDGAMTLARNTGYIFPLFADAADWKPRGSVLNAGVGGLYAAGCILAAQLFGDRAYLEEAQTALTVIHQLPPPMLTHEPQQLTFAAAAARMLAVSGFGDDWRQVAADFVQLSLRMGYWGDDPAVDYYDPRGMFQACASLGYPAYKENIETLLAWPELLHDDSGVLPVDLMAAFANLQRVHNKSFFDPYLPHDMRRGPCPHIPYEDLATAEFPHTAKLGKELYGTGEVFWSALLFDPLGVTDDEVLVLSLDMPCLELGRMPVHHRRVLMYTAASDREIVVQSGEKENRIKLLSKVPAIIEGL